MASPAGDCMKTSSESTNDNMVSLANTDSSPHTTSSTSKSPPKSFATIHAKVPSSGEHTNTPTSDNNMPSLVTSADQRPPPSWGGLPAELKRLIVHVVEDSCLANLRLTNKELNAMSTKLFGERMLAERRFMLSEYSLKGLVDLTAHPEFGPCVRKILFSTHTFTDEVDSWRKTIGKRLPPAERRARWKSIQSVERRSTSFIKTGKPINILAQALSNLKKHGNLVTLGVFDDVIAGASEVRLRRAYGFDEFWAGLFPLIDLTPDQWVACNDAAFFVILEAIDQSGFSNSPVELDLASAIRDPYTDLDELLNDSVITDEGMLQRNVDVCIKVGLDWTFRFSRPDVGNDRLVFDYQGTTILTGKEDEVEPDSVPEIVRSGTSLEPRYHYGWGTCSLYSPCVLGDFNESLAMEDMTEVRFSSCASEAHYLACGICRLGKTKLQKLVLVDVHVFGPDFRGFLDEKNSAWPWLTIFRKLLKEECPGLRSLVMEQVFFHAETRASPAVIVRERREWKGVSGVYAGLGSLISEMTSLDEEQRERWFAGEIDADGNAIVEELVW